MIRLFYCLLCAVVMSAPLHAGENDGLSGLIWNVGQQEFVSVPDLIADIRSTRFIVIGERHGRDAHQGRAAFLIKALADRGRYPAIALEMLDQEQTKVVSVYRATSPEYARGLGIVLDWAESGWPAWLHYEPVFDAAFATKAQIIGADLPDLDQQRVLAGIDDHDTGPGFSHYKASMTKAHCGLIDVPRAKALARLQIARDRNMATQMQIHAHDTHGAILIAGSSHVRKTTGIPLYLPAEDTAVIVLLETNATRAAFPDPLQAIPEGARNAYDYIWFTPKSDEIPFCNRIGRPSPASEQDKN